MIISKVKNKFFNIFSPIYIKHYKKKLKKKLNNENFTILASNCAAGIIYNRFEHKFMSPTINMWFKQREFIKFCCNLQHYVNCNLEFVKLEEYNYPVARLDDIYLYFNHSKSEEEAAENWYKRVKRINYNNLYILMYDRGAVSTEDYLKLSEVKCNNIVVFTDKKDHPDLDFLYYIKPNDTYLGDSYLDRDIWTLTTLEKKFDFVSFLNKIN